jgi:hypothetical protein
MRGLSSSVGECQVHIRKWTCGLFAAAVISAPAWGASQAVPIVVTLDARDYVTYSTTTLTPSASVLSVVDSGISNCRRGDGTTPLSGPWKLHRSAETLDIDFQTVRIEFHPTRLVLDSATHDIVCDGQALGWQTGIGRVFQDDFDA